ncbi:unnamed protein product [Spodoptera exigua]|nr:unnamed protein product [Spodoptera exigua]
MSVKKLKDDLLTDTVSLNAHPKPLAGWAESKFYEMRSFVIIVVLSALAACYGSSVLPGKANMFSSFVREQMSKGWILEHNEEDAAQNRVTLTKGEGETREGMRSFVIIVVLSAVAACYGSSILPGKANMFSSFVREQMSKGWILEHNEEDAAQNRVTLTKGETSDDYILFYQQTCYVPAIPYDFGRCDVVYRGEPNEKIYSIQITSSWPPPSYIHSEGLGTNVGRMRSFIIIVVLSAVAACYGSSILPGKANMFSSFVREQMSKGWILEHNEEDAAQNRVTLTKGETSDDYILFYQQTCYVPAIPYDFGRCDVVYRGEPNEKIYSIQITSYWPPPSYIHSEGLGTNVGRVRIVSQWGEMLYTIVRMYGKIIEDNSES